MSEGGSDKLPDDVVVSNLGESVFQTTARSLTREMEALDKNATALANPLKKLKRKLELLQDHLNRLERDHAVWKRQMLTNVVHHMKRKAINVEPTPLAAQADGGVQQPQKAPRTNAYTVGDFKRIREPELKKRKKIRLGAAAASSLKKRPGTVEISKIK